MFSHLCAVLLATGTLVLVGTAHTVATTTAGTQIAIALIPASGPAHGAPLHTAVRAIAIGY